MNKHGMTDVGSTNRAVDEKMESFKETVKGLADQGAQKVDALKAKVITEATAMASVSNESELRRAMRGIG